MSNSLQYILSKIHDFKRKYYKNLLIKGIFSSVLLLLTAFLLFNVLEYVGRFGSFMRAIFLISFIVMLAYSIIFWVLKPILFLFKIGEPLTDTQAAIEIGRFFPEVGDRLLNTLQLAQLSEEENSLLQASINQKTNELKFIKFTDAIKIEENRKYLKYLLPLAIIFFIILILSPGFFKKNSERIVYFQKSFAEEAPFKFQILNKELVAIKNEDFTIRLALIGNTIPESVYLVAYDRKYKMQTSDSKNYSFTFSKVQESIDFHFIASGFQSNSFELELVNKPNLLSFDVELEYPSYLNKPSEKLENVGNLLIPEGTQVLWNFKSANTDSLIVQFDGEKGLLAKDGFGDNFSFQRMLKKSGNYKILLKNQAIRNSENIEFYINVIPDRYPQIQVEQLKDTTLFNFIALGGNISDDYGLQKFKLFYRIANGTNSSNFTEASIPFNQSQVSQSFYYQLSLNSLLLSPGDKVEYFLQLWDNDGVNGSKSTKTPVLSFSLPSIQKFEAEVEKSSETTEKMLEKLNEKSKRLKAELASLENKLKSKKELDFQEKKQLEELIKKREELSDEMKNLQKQFQQLQEKSNRFQQQSPELQKKMEMLDKLMKEVMNEETQKLYEELKQMLDKDTNEKTIEQLEKLKNQERNLDKDIDRTLKLFKQLQLQQKTEKVANDLEKLAEKQENLSNQSEKNQTDDLKQEQEKLSKEFENKKDDLKDLEKMAKEIKKEIDTKEEEQKNISEEQKQAEKNLENNDAKSAAKNQKKAAKKMKDMASEMKQAMKNQQSIEMNEDLEALRAILENLVKLSFDQERIMKDIRTTNLSDPRFVKLSQDQLKLQDDSKVIEDSLYALSKRVLQIQSFVTRELTSMRNYIDESVKIIKERKLNVAASKQQFAMTSINNLALMLNGTFSQMQDMMANAMPGMGKKQNKGKNKSPMSIGQAQEKLNQSMEKASKSGQSGKGLSEAAAKLAQEQAMLRKRIQELQEELKGTELGKKLGGELKELEKRMDDNETDLVNKRINPNLINRSREIQTRLLEAEKAIQQQEEDPTRKAKTAQQFNRNSPPELEKFLNDKQKQVELIRTVPPSYSPFYKKQTDNYFRKIK